MCLLKQIITHKVLSTFIVYIHCFIHLNAMKHHYTKKRQFELDVIEQGNLDQINDLLDDITGGIERGGFTELEVRYIYDDTEGLWTDVSTDFRKVIF
ncbi:hypothetical protein [Streptococcus agalactiae]|uniref:hypothetical protein n=2 Tax=Streptococcus agalactiae TaxID=1311 RepID=UPI0021473225|nr:hypothetical protein [Streptococcus agalactiae]